MDRYTIYCTEEQTVKAIELGAPIKEIAYPEQNEKYIRTDHYRLYAIPTADQMIGWLEDGLLEEVHIEQDIDGLWSYIIYGNGNDLFGISNLYPTRKEATIAAIDAALEYIENLKQ